MKKAHIIYSLLLGLVPIAISCEDIDKEEIYQEQYHKILMLDKTDMVGISLFKTGEDFDTDFDFSIMKSGTSPETTADAVVTIMSREELDDYCSQKGLEVNPLPESYYELSDNTFHFDSNERYKKLSVSMHTKNICELPVESNYVIPLILKSKNDSVNAQRNVLMINPQIVIPSVKFNNTGLMPYYCGKGSTTIDIPLHLDMENRWDFTCKVEMDPSAAADHPLLSKGYTLANNGVVNFKAGSSESSLQVTINRENAGLTELNMETTVLPLAITEISKDFDLGTEPILVGVTAKYPLTAAMLSTNAQEPSEGSLANLLDGKIGTFFHSAWSVAIEGDHYVQVDLPESFSNFMFSYTTRANNGRANPAWFDVECSQDGKTFALVKDFAWDTDNLPGEAAATYNSPYLTTDAPFKSLRFTCLGNWEGNPFFVWSEFSLYAF